MEVRTWVMLTELPSTEMNGWEPELSIPRISKRAFVRTYSNRNCYHTFDYRTNFLLPCYEGSPEAAVTIFLSQNLLTNRNFIRTSLLSRSCYCTVRTRMCDNEFAVISFTGCEHKNKYLVSRCPQTEVTARLWFFWRQILLPQITKCFTAFKSMESNFSKEFT